MKKIKFKNTSKDKNIGFSANEITFLIEELNIQNEVFINYLEQAGKKSNLFDVTFLDAKQYCSLQKEFRTLIDNDPDVDLNTNSVCFFNCTIDHYSNKCYYFVHADENLTIPKTFYYSAGEIPIGVNFRDERTKKIGIVDIKSDFIDHINYKTELKFGTGILNKITGFFGLILLFPFWFPLLVYFEIKRRF